MELDTIPLFFLFTTAILCALLVVARSKRSLTSHVPPSPWRLPLVGNLHQLTGLVPHRSLASLAIVHGPVMLLHLGQVPAVIVSSARAAQEVLQTKDHLFATRPSLAIPKKLFYGCTDIAFAPHGPYWLQARKMGVLHLLSSKRVQAYRTVREEEVEALVQRVDQACDGGRSIVRLSDLFAGYAKDVSGRIVFGATAAMRGEEWGAKVDVLLHEGNALLGRFNLGDCFPSLPWLGALDGTDAKVRKAFERIDQILEEIIDVAEKEMGVREEVGQRDSTFLTVLMSFHKTSGGAEWTLSRDNVKALISNLFGAGAEATIVVLEWIISELLRNEGAMGRLQNELRKYTQMNNMITEQDLQGMVYLKAVIKETIRLHPPGPLMLPHEAMECTTIQQYNVPSKTMVIINAWAICRDPDTWECPEEFLPERFLGSDVDFWGQHFHMIPFGSGRRMCPGINFIMSILEITIANLLSRFDWALPEGAELDMEELPGVTSRKRLPLCVLATPRA